MTASGTPVRDNGRILIIRLSSLGDILLTTPVVRLLHQLYPQASIDFLVKATYQDVLRSNPCIARLHLLQEGQTLYQTLSRLRQTRYTLVLDLHRNLRSWFLSHGLRGHQKLAYNKHRLRRALLVRLGWNTLAAMTPVPELYAAPLRRLGITTPLPAPEMHLAPGSQEAMHTYLVEAFATGHTRPLLAVAPGARWPTKRWPVERFAAVAQELAMAQQAAVVILGDITDKPLAQELCCRLTVPVLDSTGMLTLMHTAALLQQCRLLLSNDSGLMHMATALQVPVVAVFGPTVQEFGFYPFQARAHVVHTDLACRPCSSKGSACCPRGHHQCMQRLPSAQVLAAVQGLWQDEAGRRR
jgi:heptosyltransferase-2